MDMLLHENNNVGPCYRVRNFRGRVSYFNQSEARKGCFLASDWLKYETLPRKFRTLYLLFNFIFKRRRTTSRSIVVKAMHLAASSRIEYQEFLEEFIMELFEIRIFTGGVENKVWHGKLASHSRYSG